MNRSYEISPRPQHLGGGWNLALFEDGERTGGGVYPVLQYESPSGAPYNNDPERVLADAYDDAMSHGEDWVASGTPN